MCLQLLNSTSPESITSCQLHLAPLLSKPVRNLCQIGGLADSIDTTENNHIGLATGPAALDVMQDVNLAFVEDAAQCLFKGLAHELAYTCTSNSSSSTHTARLGVMHENNLAVVESAAKSFLKDL